MYVTRYLLGHGLLCVVSLYELHQGSPGCCCTGATLEWHHDCVIWGSVMAPLWLYYGFVVAAAAAALSVRREVVLWLPCQLGENKHVCISYGPSCLLPASYLKPCLPWVQWTVKTLWKARQLCHELDQQYMFPKLLQKNIFLIFFHCMTCIGIFKSAISDCFLLSTWPLTFATL